MTELPVPTPAHTLLALALASPIRERQTALDAWLALPLGESGVAADGDTDLTFALRHAQAHQEEAWLLRLLERHPDQAWLRAKDGHDALSLAIGHDHLPVLTALLARLDAPTPEELAARRYPGTFEPRLYHNGLVAAMARKGQSQALEVWRERVGPWPREIWEDSHPRLSGALTRAGIVPLPQAADAWRTRQRYPQGGVTAGDVTALMTVMPEVENSPESALKDLVAVIREGQADWGPTLDRLDDPSTWTVRRPGPDRTTVPWSTLGIAWWETIGKIAERHRTQFHVSSQLEKNLARLRGEREMLPLAPGLAAGPLMGWLALANARRHAPLDLGPIEDWEAWSGRSREDLLRDAVPLTAGLAAGPLGSTGRGKWLRGQWNELWVRTIDKRAQGAPDLICEAAVRQAMLTPDLAPAFGDWGGNLGWITTASGVGHAWNAAAEGWWKAQPHALGLLITLAHLQPAQPDLDIFRSLVGKEVKRRWSQGERLDPADPLHAQHLATLATDHPDLFAQARHEELARRPAAAIPARQRRRT